jgi:uncharacterized protein
MLQKKKSNPTNRQLIIYCSSLFLLSWCVQIAAIIITGSANSPETRPWLVATMFTPSVVTIAYLIVHPQLRTKLLWKPNWSIFRISFIAVLVPIIIAFLVLLFIQQMGYGNSGWLHFSSTGVRISGGPFLLGIGTQSWLLFIANILITGVIYSLINGIVATGEEFAWRGFLQGILIERLGTIKGIALLGFLWSMWHLPMLLDGYNFPETPLLGSFVIFPILSIAYSFFMGWLTLYSQSFIPAAIAHGAVNSIMEGIISNINMDVPRIYEDLITLSVAVVIGLFFMFLLKRIK